ncbi:hypothetical protein, conserved [Trypanosoma brucei brucei TREU927]|uniref:Uncharacterized protein n=1 Tax=Trypanosoma brucei brucei (strain 927/4 GUTat10.1) TaxID=185431 RepID=Q586T7_TRYB2|nr:hypothetical protein, conserved [Trypanosoma brucei brucei TREU927]AAQ15957.1 hypothetical protein, conserved [Trypanosoma brucei brucei TREU927]AAX80150.1 hypothetical protein, conserved [Trypanosoma brucei]
MCAFCAFTRGVLGRRTFLRTRLRRNIYIPSSTIRIVFMTQEHGSEEGTLNALRTALSSGKADSIRTLDENAVLLHHKQAVPELLQLCNSVGGSHSMSLLNTAWKLLLSVAALKDVTAGLYCKILHFMLSQLQHHIFSHDWSDPKQIKLTTFVASYLVSTVRKHPSFAVRDEAFVNSILDLHITTVFTLVTTENGEAAQQLQKQVGVRLLGTLGALGGTLGEQQVGEDGGWSPLLVKCLRTAPSEVATSLGDEVDVDSITAVAAMTAMLAMARSMVPLLEKPASLERLLEVSLLWLPDMTVVLVEQDSGACALHKRVSQLAKELPREVYYAGRGHEVEAMESSQELDLGAQLMLLLRSTVRRSVQLDQQDGNLEKNGSGFMCGVLQRFRVFSILLAALLVPNDTSAARVLLVWEAALHALPGALRRTLGEELLLLGEGQLCALRRSHTLQHDKVETLRRFLNLLAVLTAEICRLLRVPPEVLTGTRNDSTVGSVPPEGPTFHRMVSILYHQSRVYQWWWEEMLVLSGNERAAGAAVSATPPGTAVSALHDELQSAFSHNEGDQKQRLCMVLTSVPGKLVEILRQCNHTSGSRSINVVPLFSVATRAIEALYNSADSSDDVRVCARFVAAEIVAVAGLLQCGDSAYSTLLHRLVQISFKPLESGSDLHGSRLSGEPADRSQCVEGILRYHAAVCLYLFAQRETSVPVAELCPGGSVATALRQILEGKGLTTGGDVTMHSCEALLAPQVTVWQMLFPHLGRVPTSETKAIKGGSQGSQLTVDASSDSSHCSSQSTPGRLLLPLQKCEETLRLFLESQESVGRSLTREETETLTRVEQLVAAAAVMLRPDIKSNGQGRFVSSEGPSGPF